MHPSQVLGAPHAASLEALSHRGFLTGALRHLRVARRREPAEASSLPARSWGLGATSLQPPHADPSNAPRASARARPMSTPAAPRVPRRLGQARSQHFREVLARTLRTMLARWGRPRSPIGVEIDGRPAAAYSPSLMFVPPPNATGLTATSAAAKQVRQLPQTRAAESVDVRVVQPHRCGRGSEAVQRAPAPAEHQGEGAPALGWSRVATQGRE